MRLEDVTKAASLKENYDALKYLLNCDPPDFVINVQVSGRTKILYEEIKRLVNDKVSLPVINSMADDYRAEFVHRLREEWRMRLEAQLEILAIKLRELGVEEA